METRRMYSGLCWFGAACLAVGGFVLVLAGIVASADTQWSPAGLLLLILAGTALVGMAVLMAVAFRVEGRNRTADPGSPVAR